MNIEDMSDRELVMGLMRGEAVSMKQGYSARSAVLTVLNLRELSETEAIELQAFADGFAHGINEDVAELQPVGV